MANKDLQESMVQAVVNDNSLQQIGKTTRIVGSKVEAINKAGDIRVLEVGDPIYLHDTIVTATDTFVTITLIDLTVFQLGPDSRATLNIYQYDKQAGMGELDADLIGGLFRFISGGIAENKEGQHSVLHTPSAKIGIRGSELDISVSDQGDTTIVHSLGFIDVATRDQASFSVFHPQTRIYISMADDIAVETALLSKQQFGSLRAWTNPLSNNQTWASTQIIESVINDQEDWLSTEPEPMPLLYLTAIDSDSSSLITPPINPSLRTVQSLETTFSTSALADNSIIEHNEPDNSFVISTEDTRLLNHRPEIKLPQTDAPLIQILEDQDLRLFSRDLLAFAEDIEQDTLQISQMSLLAIDGEPPIASLSQYHTGEIVISPNENANGWLYLQYQVSDSQGGQSDPAVVPILIQAQNDPPLVHGRLQLNIASDHNLSLSSQQILSLVNDIEGHQLQIVAFQDEAYNTYQQGLVNDGSGNQWQILTQENEILGLMLSPAPYFYGDLTVQALVIDLPEDGTLPAPVLVPIDITVSPVLTELIAHDDSYQTHTLSPEFSLLDILANDEYNPDTIKKFEIIASDFGEAIYNQEQQTLLFNTETPLLNARIDYQIEDQWQQKSEASIYIEWTNQVPHAVDDILYLPADSDSLISIEQLLNNDLDPEQDRLQLEQINHVINGQLSLYDENNLLFQPDSNFASQGGSFQYQVQDNFSNSEAATVELQVLSGSFLTFKHSLQWTAGQQQIALLQGFEYNSAYLNISEQPVLALQLADPSYGSLHFQASNELTQDGGQILRGQQTIAQIATDPSEGHLLLQFDEYISDSDLQKLLNSLYFSPADLQNDQDASVNIQLYQDIDAWLAQAPALDEGSSRELPLPVIQFAHDDIIELAFASPERLSLDSLLNNDIGTDLSISGFDDISPGVQVSLQDQQLQIFVDINNLSDNRAQFSYSVTDAQGNQQQAQVQLKPNNYQIGDSQPNRLNGSENTDILQGEAGDDILDGKGGQDLLYGGAGDDILKDSSGQNQLFGGLGDDIIQLSRDQSRSYIDGGAGEDSLQLRGEQMSLDLISNRLLLADEQLQLQNIEHIDLGNGHNQIILQIEDVLQINDAQNLFIEDINGSVISAAEDWQYQGKTELNDQTYSHYSWQNPTDMASEGAELYVQTQLNQFIF